MGKQLYILTDKDHIGVDLDQQLAANVLLEEQLRIDAFAKYGIQSKRIYWRDNTIDFYIADMALVPSTWDYIWHIDEFCAKMRSLQKKTVVNQSCSAYDMESTQRLFKAF
ncbi:MAG: hypothetical protein OIF50_08650 [Flavobacteriaceae bacterium]|nr:hypothetical protein [Flavobacteriaceae bacterium]